MGPAAPVRGPAFARWSASRARNRPRTPATARNRAAPGRVLAVRGDATYGGACGMTGNNGWRMACGAAAALLLVVLSALVREAEARQEPWRGAELAVVLPAE
ncbi:hypothetical protein GCM10022227_40600 [Streptomyces sedi]